MAGIPQYHQFQSYNTPRSTPPAFQPMPASQPRPLYFISRHTGVMVPLVPADELPFNVRLQGVPRVMRMEDTFGMQHVGMAAPYTGMTFTLERDIHIGAETPEAVQMTQRFTSQPPPAVTMTGHVRSQSGLTTKYLAPDALARQALAQSASNTAACASNGATPSRPLSAHGSATTWRSSFNPTSAAADTPTKTLATIPLASVDTTQFTIDAILATKSGAQEAARLNYISKSGLPPPPSGSQPNAEKKEYCTYWIRTGECDYMQQGCLYKHEMPDRATLERCGFRGVPRWWTEKQRLLRPAGVGEKLVTVGPVVKSSEWLKEGSKTDDNGSESEGSKAGSVSSEESVESGEVEKKVTVLAKPAVPEQTKTELKKDAKIADTKSTSTRAAPPPAIGIRKISTTSDITDLAAPLLPTPPSSAPSLTTSTSTHSSPRQGQTTPLTPPTPNLPPSPPTVPATATIKPTKVFVPRGESPAQHIADARKRHQTRQHARRGAPVPTVVGSVVPLEKQIQETQKAKAQAKQQLQLEDRKPRETKGKGLGLMASQHAPKALAESADAGARKADPSQSERKQVARTGCRIRRPAVSARPVAEAPVKILKKAEAVGAVAQ